MAAGRGRTPVMPAHYTRNEIASRGAVAQFYRDWHGPAQRVPLVRVAAPAARTGHPWGGRHEQVHTTTGVSSKE